MHIVRTFDEGESYPSEGETGIAFENRYEALEAVAVVGSCIDLYSVNAMVVIPDIMDRSHPVEYSSEKVDALAQKINTSEWHDRIEKVEPYWFLDTPQSKVLETMLTALARGGPRRDLRKNQLTPAHVASISAAQRLYTQFSDGRSAAEATADRARGAACSMWRTRWHNFVLPTGVVIDKKPTEGDWSVKVSVTTSLLP